MTKQIDFREKYGSWALVTGASSGIGKAITLELAQLDFNLIIVGRNMEKLEELSKGISGKYGTKVHLILADLSTQKGIQEVIEQSNAFDIGFFVHAAGMESHGLFTDRLVDDESKLIHLNIQSTMLLTHHFAKAMTAKGKGGILLVASLTGHMISPYFSSYAASKAYIINFGLSLRSELREKGVTISVLSPGLTSTPMSETIGKDIDWSKTPMKLMTTGEVAKEAMQQFGKKASIIPGVSNRITSFFATRIAPQFFGKNNEKMMRKAFKEKL